MKVFISWSGEPSRELALVLADWLPRVLQAVHPFVSSVDIDKGDTWVSKLQDELETTEFGIVCVTPTNVTSPWLHYEAGALGKSVDSRVCPVLLGIDKEAVRPPLSQLQLTSLAVDEMKLLLRSLNKASGSTVIDSKLEEAVDVWWGQLESATEKINLSEERDTSERGTEPNKPHLTDRELMVEVLTEVRSLGRAVNWDARLTESVASTANRKQGMLRDAMGQLHSLAVGLDENLSVSGTPQGFKVELPGFSSLLPDDFKWNLSNFAVAQGLPVRVNKGGVEVVTFKPDGQDDEIPF